MREMDREQQQGGVVSPDGTVAYLVNDLNPTVSVVNSATYCLSGDSRYPKDSQSVLYLLPTIAAFMPWWVCVPLLRMGLTKVYNNFPQIGEAQKCPTSHASLPHPFAGHPSLSVRVTARMLPLLSQ